MTTIIEELNSKWDTVNYTHVANVPINTVSYTINVGKEEGHGEIEGYNINIYCSKPGGQDWTEKNLQELFKDFCIKHTDGKPSIFVQGQSCPDLSKQLSCDGVQFATIDAGNVGQATCTAIDFTIIEQVQGLQTDGTSVNIAKIGIDSREYIIKFKKDSTAGSGKAEIDGTDIIILSATAPNTSQKLQDKIGEYYVKWSDGKLKIVEDASEKAKQLECNSSLFDETGLDNCTAIDVSKTVQEENLAELEKLEDTCGEECPYSEESFDKTADTIQYFPDEMTEQEVENIVKSYEVLDRNPETIEEFNDALWCLFQGGEDCTIDT